MKKVLIIGATSTIAQEVAKIYAAEKAELVLIGRQAQLLDIIAQDLRVRGAAKTAVLVQDLNILESHGDLIESAHSHLKKFDVVLLAQGILGDQKKAEAQSEALLEILYANFLSHASLLTFIANKMQAQKSGTIAVISSVAGDRGRQSNYAYGSAMAAKTAFTDGLRNRLFPYGVHVVTLKLGFVDTAMTKEFKKGPMWAQPSKVAKGITQAVHDKSDVVYLPFFWRFIMLIIKNIPEKIFKKLKL